MWIFNSFFDLNMLPHRSHLTHCLLCSVLWDAILDPNSFPPPCVSEFVCFFHSQLCVFKDIVRLVAIVWYLRMWVLMTPVGENAQLNWLHLYWLFPTVRFQMSPQSACTKGCIVTLVAFMWCFSTVCFQMCPQIFCVWSFRVTLVTLVWLLSNVHFQMCL